MTHYVRLRFFAVLLLLGSVSHMYSQQNESPSLFAANAVRESLTEKGTAPEMTAIPRTAAELRTIVSRHLDPRLLNESPTIFGRDFQYRFADAHRTAQLGVIILGYPTARVASQMVSTLASHQNFFRNSEILIRYSVAPLNNLVVVSYSENSGDKRMVRAIDGLPASFEKASSVNGHVWKDPDSPDAQ
jgi:hypothetical protein